MNFVVITYMFIQKLWGKKFAKTYLFSNVKRTVFFHNSVLYDKLDRYGAFILTETETKALFTHRVDNHHFCPV